jgi:hypothetical protein
MPRPKTVTVKPMGALDDKGASMGQAITSTVRVFSTDFAM